MFKGLAFERQILHGETKAGGTEKILMNNSSYVP